MSSSQRGPDCRFGYQGDEVTRSLSKSKVHCDVTSCRVATQVASLFRQTPQFLSHLSLPTVVMPPVSRRNHSIPGVDVIMEREIAVLIHLGQLQQALRDLDEKLRQP